MKTKDFAFIKSFLERIAINREWCIRGFMLVFEHDESTNYMEIALLDLSKYNELKIKLTDEQIVNYIMEIIEFELIESNISPTKTIQIRFDNCKTNKAIQRVINPRHYKYNR